MKAAAFSSSCFVGTGEEDRPSSHHLSPPPPQPQPPAAVAQSAAPPGKSRNLPGNPNPGAEVIALSPKTLLATSRFFCQVCGKGFQREQNLQLHRRGHNLPWKLKRKSPDDEAAARRRVYLCPEPTCAHHDPSRALGDLAGVKKHYSRKHGEKRWKCDRCSRRYAVQSDWKAHAKICGTREYRCNCGTLFSRSDSFIAHRAFCDALTQENARLPPAIGIGGHSYANKGVSYLGLPQLNSQIPDSFQLRAAGDSTTTHEQSFNVDVPRLNTASFLPLPHSSHGQLYLAGEGSYNDLHGFSFEDPPLLQGDQFGFGASSSAGNNYFNNNLCFFPTAGENEQDQSGGGGNVPTAVSSLLAGVLMGHQAVAGSNMSMTPSLYDHGPPLPQLSATVLLQKAARLGATSSFAGSGGGLLRSNDRQYQKITNSLGGLEVAADHQMAAGGFRRAMQPDDVEKEKLNTRDFLGVGGTLNSLSDPWIIPPATTRSVGQKLLSGINLD
ncbi:zinc finger protein GAI-ASSOCIATED FACTOR 1-like [Curcuma longa]|uniref:zinc finger protein GAI-ASSOCIATED FACTOR 1-like n=1 Tax=Curcuma longa TaxID=136217 RepID=UPI003D9F79C5